MGVGVFPGSFDPLTVAHVAIADAAIGALGLARVDLTVSEVALAKEHGGHSSVEARLAAIEALGRADIGARSTDAQLIADIAAGYDVCIVGADKWHQLHDVAFYGGSTAARDAALDRLPTLAVVPRAGYALPSRIDGAVRLDVDPALGEVSSSGVRAGRTDWRA